MRNRFLTTQDYILQVQKEDLLQILGEKTLPWVEAQEPWDVNNIEIKNQQTYEILYDAEQTAQEELSSYLRGRYKIEEVFPPTQTFFSAGTYFANNLVTYEEPKWLSATTYNQGDRFSYRKNIYECIISGGTSAQTPSLTSSAYTFVTENKSFYYANLPCSKFDYKTNYNEGQIVWFEDTIYQAKQSVKGTTPGDSQNLDLRYGIPSVTMGHSNADPFLSFYNWNQNPLPKVNTNYWSVYEGHVNNVFTATSANLSTYYFSGFTPDNSLYWTKGDNRNHQIKLYMIDAVLFHLLSRLNPRNVSELRETRYKTVIDWLKNVQKGKVELDVPIIVPTQGGSIRWGSQPRQNMTY